MGMSTCGGCGKIFASISLFDAHRVGSYGEPNYDPRDLEKENRKRVLSYGPSQRRCLTSEELLAAGYLLEHKTIGIVREGQASKAERDIWYDPIAREQAREAFGRKSPDDE